MMSEAAENFNVELSPESHDEKVRHAFGRPYTNESMETLIENLIEAGCQRIDLFFMVGLPHQDYQSTMATADYCDRLLKHLGKSKVTTPFISPLAPFVDPGSMVFDSPEEHGYKLLFRDVESHRQAMLQPGWKYFLNYETDWMNRDEIVDSTYRSALALNKVKMEHGLITRQTYRPGGEEDPLFPRRGRQDRRRHEDGPGERERRIGELRIDVEKNISTIGEKKELEWPTGMLRMNFFNIMKTLRDDEEHLRKIPKVDDILKDEGGRRWPPIPRGGEGRPAGCARELEGCHNGRHGYRQCLRRGPSSRRQRSGRRSLWLPTLKRVINGTGVVIHTNLGRIPLAASVIERLTAAASGYSNVEYNLEEGSQGRPPRPLPLHSFQAHGRRRRDHRQQQRRGRASCAQYPGRRQGSDHRPGGADRDRRLFPDSGGHEERAGRFCGRWARRTGPSSRITRAPSTEHRPHHEGPYEQLQDQGVCPRGDERGAGRPFPRGAMSPSFSTRGAASFPLSAASPGSREPSVAGEMKKGVGIVSFSGDKLLGGPQAGIILGQEAGYRRIRKQPPHQGPEARQAHPCGAGSDAPALPRSDEKAKKRGAGPPDARC